VVTLGAGNVSQVGPMVLHKMISRDQGQQRASTAEQG
jgi:hypothetical protein